jgi:hypothetical protein
VGALDLVGQRAAIAMKNRGGAGVQEIADFGGYEISAQDEHCPARIAARYRRRRLVRAHQRLKRSLKVLNIGRSAFVQNHQIDRQLFQSPIFVGAQEFADQFEMAVILDPHQHNGRSPEIPCAQSFDALPAPRFENVTRRSQRRIGIENVIGKPLEQMRIVRVDAEMVQLHLGLRAGERLRSVKRHRLMMLVDEIEHLIAGGSGQRPERDARRRSARNPHMLAQAEVQ